MDEMEAYGEEEEEGEMEMDMDMGEELQNIQYNPLRNK
jgi:hypothetical protein